jgi:hypothetical protein
MTDSERHLNNVTIRLGDRVPPEMRRYLDPMPHSLERHRGDEDAFYFTATMDRPDDSPFGEPMIALVVVAGCLGTAALLGWGAYWVWSAINWVWRNL